MTPMVAACAFAISALSFGLRTPDHGLQPPQPASDRSKQQSVEHYRAGQDALRSEKYEIAEREFQTSIKLDPTYELPRYGLGQTYMAMKRYPDAIVAFQKCRDVFHANATTDSADDMKRQQRIDDQLKELEDQKRLYQSPGHGTGAPMARQYVQQLDVQINTLKEARARRTTTGDEPTPAWLSLALGSADFRSDKYADAEREYTNAIDVNPKFGEAHSNLAVLYLMSGRPKEAQTEIDAAEKAGFKVNPQLKADVKNALKKS
jgi:tetratricopeptide (TPR) repeat protein